VIDASALGDYLLRVGFVDAVAATVEESTNELYVPYLCDVEILSTLRNRLLRDELDFARALEAATDYFALRLRRHDHAQLAGRVIELHSNFTAYDATYVALAEHLGATLLTVDRPLARAVQRHTEVPLTGPWV
jgi:predicted nucleic acid-binding protein